MTTDKYRIASALCLSRVIIAIIEASNLFSVLNNNMIQLIIDVYTLAISFYVLLLLQKVLSTNFNCTKANVTVILILIFATMLFIFKQRILPSDGLLKHLLTFNILALPVAQFYFALILLKLKNKGSRILHYYAILLMIKSPTFLIVLYTMKAIFLLTSLNIACDLMLATFFYLLDHDTARISFNDITK